MGQYPKKDWQGFVDEVSRLLVDAQKEMTYREIATLWGMCEDIVRTHAPPKFQPFVPEYHPLIPKERQKVANMFQAGLTNQILQFLTPSDTKPLKDTFGPIKNLVVGATECQRVVLSTGTPEVKNQERLNLCNGIGVHMSTLVVETGDPLPVDDLGWLTEQTNEHTNVHVTVHSPGTIHPSTVRGLIHTVNTRADRTRGTQAFQLTVQTDRRLPKESTTQLIRLLMAVDGVRAMELRFHSAIPGEVLFALSERPNWDGIHLALYLHSSVWPGLSLPPWLSFECTNGPSHLRLQLMTAPRTVAGNADDHFIWRWVQDNTQLQHLHIQLLGPNIPSLKLPIERKEPLETLQVDVPSQITLGEYDFWDLLPTAHSVTLRTAILSMDMILQLQPCLPVIQGGMHPSPRTGYIDRSGPLRNGG